MTIIWWLTYGFFVLFLLPFAMLGGAAAMPDIAGPIVNTLAFLGA